MTFLVPSPELHQPVYGLLTAIGVRASASTASARVVFSWWRMRLVGLPWRTSASRVGGGRDCVPFGAVFSGRGRQRVLLGAPRDPRCPR